MTHNKGFVFFVAAALTILSPAADAAWALRQMVPAERKAGLEELDRSLRGSGERPQPDLPSVAAVLYSYPDLFNRFFGASGHMGRYRDNGWNDFLKAVRQRSPTDYSLLLHLEDPEGYLLHGDLLLNKSLGQAFLITGNPGSGKSLLAAVAVGGKDSGWKRPDPRSVWDYLVNDQVLILKTGGTLLAGLPPPQKPISLMTKFPIQGAMPGYSNPPAAGGQAPDFWKVGIYEQRRFVPLAGIFWLNHDRAKRTSRNWRDLLGTETITDGWSRSFTRRFHRLPVRELYVAGPAEPEKLVKRLSGMARWAKQTANKPTRSGLEETVLLEPGAERYEETVGRAGEIGVEGVLEGPLGDYLKGLKPGEAVRLRVAGETPEEEKEWEKFGLSRLADPIRVWELAKPALPRAGLMLTREEKAGGVRWEYVELKLSHPVEVSLPGLSDPVRMDRLRLFPSRTVSFEASGITLKLQERKDAFVNQVRAFLGKGSIDLVGVPLGLPTQMEKGKFAGLAGLLREDVPEDLWRDRVLSEPEVTARHQAVMDKMQADLKIQAAKEVQGEVESLKEQLLGRIRALREGPDGPYLSIHSLARIEQQVHALSPEDLVGRVSPARPGEGIRDLAGAARARLERLGGDLQAQLAKVDQALLESEQLRPAVEKLRAEFPELKVLIPGSAPGSPSPDFSEALIEAFSGKPARREHWGPAQTARLLRRIRALKERVRGIKAGHWFEAVYLNLSKSHEYLVASAMDDNGKGVLTLHPLQGDRPQPALEINDYLIFGAFLGSLTKRLLSWDLVENRFHPDWAEIPAFPKVRVDDQLLDAFVNGGEKSLPGTRLRLTIFVFDRLAVSLGDPGILEGLNVTMKTVLSRLESGLRNRISFNTAVSRLNNAVGRMARRELIRKEGQKFGLLDQLLPILQESPEVNALFDRFKEDEGALAALAFLQADLDLNPGSDRADRAERIQKLVREMMNELEQEGKGQLWGFYAPGHEVRVQWGSVYQTMVRAYTDYGRGIRLKPSVTAQTGLEERAIPPADFLERYGQRDDVRRLLGEGQGRLLAASEGMSRFHLYTDPTFLETADELLERHPVQGIRIDVDGEFREHLSTPRTFHPPGLIIRDKELPDFEWSDPRMKADAAYRSEMEQLTPLAWIAVGLNRGLTIQEVLNLRLRLLTFTDEQGRTLHAIFA